MVGTAVSVLVLVLVSVSVSAAGGVYVLTRPPLTCGHQGLQCEVSISNCMDHSWLKVSPYTPTAPQKLQVSLGSRLDPEGRLQPVINASWELSDDGSISFVKASELQLLVLSTNEYVCVRYTFQQQLPMRRQTGQRQTGQKWSFSADMLVVTPGESYRVSVFNIPRPEQDHSNYDVNMVLTVPDCRQDTMKETQYCIERGSLWKPNISLGRVPTGGRASSSSSSRLAVAFTSDQLCEDYTVIVSACSIQQYQRVAKANQTTLNVTFSLEHWPTTCCQFTVEVKPWFPQCANDCSHESRTVNFCRTEPEPVTAKPISWTMFVVFGVLLLVSVIAALSMFSICRTKHKRLTPQPPGGRTVQPKQPQQAPKLLVIYSQDHRLYRDVVLKLVSFLQAQCGVKVLVDLLDSNSLGLVGRVRWLELQRRQLTGPSDKILVLCSRGLQAKWRALCAQGSVTLREDLLSPTDDLCVPFLNLFVPDLHHAGMLGKYLVGFFEDISSERDVPSLFDIAVKYKLMKQFEEMFLRILDVEKFQAGQCLHIEGIGGDEFFKCPSGQALQEAIRTFHAYQLENPDWFERECVNSNEEFLKETSSFMDLESVLPTLPVLECVPLVRNGPQVLRREVEVKENSSSVLVLTAESNLTQQTPIAELTVGLKSIRHQCSLHLNQPSENYNCPDIEDVYEVGPVSRTPRPQTHMCPPFITDSSQEQNEAVGEDSQQSLSQHLLASRGSSPLSSSGLGMKLGSMMMDLFPSAGHNAVEVDEEEEGCVEQQQVLLLSDHAKQSVSDQGYGSRMSSPHEAPLKNDPLEDERLKDDPMEDYTMEDHTLQNYPLKNFHLEDHPVEDYPQKDHFLGDYSLDNQPPDEDPLEALRRLQEELLRSNLRYFDIEG